MAEDLAAESGEKAPEGPPELIGATGIVWLRDLISLMNENDLGEVSLVDGTRRVRLRKASACAPAPTMVAAAGAAIPAVAPVAEAPAAGSTVAGNGAAESGVVELKSPMVGTFYRAASPDAAPFVEVGDAVSEDSTVCIIEAMKVMNEINAELVGVVAEILVANGEAVEYGQPLLRLRKTA